MAEVKITINKRPYTIACDEGQQQRVVDLAHFVDTRLSEIAASGAGTNDSHLLVLTSIIMADELFETRDAAANSNRTPLNGLEITPEDEGEIVQAIDQMTGRIEAIAGNLSKI